MTEKPGIQQVPCYRCSGQLLNHEAVAAMVDRIPISRELKAEDHIMEKRLAVCYACEAAREGLFCAYCGCFLLSKVRLQKAYCPHPAGGKWEE